jgi:prepilin-type N-terminal cleavage/methylation domain-containing protein
MQPRTTQPCRLRAPVPTLAALARAPRASRGFTLVEVLVAVAISSLIILTAVSCFRMITKAISAANALSTENALLRTGFQLSLLDVDYWHSHADSQPPFGKGFMRQASGVDDPSTTAVYENGMRRPFQPVRYASRTDAAERDPVAARGQGLYNAASPSLGNWANSSNQSGDFYNDKYNRNDYVPNPNTMLANDGRSIARVHLRPNRQPQIEAADGIHMGIYRLASPKFAIGDYSLVSASDMRDASATNPRYPLNNGAAKVRVTLNTTPSLPAYALATPALGQWPTGATRTNAWPDPAGVFIDMPKPIDNGVAMYQPLLWTSLFQRLGYFGCYQYMTAGTPLLWGDRYGRTPEVNTVPVPPYTYYPHMAANAGIPDYFQYVWDRDFCFNMGNCDLAVRMGERFIPTQSNGGWNGRATEALPLRVCWPEVQDQFKANFDQNQHDNPFAILIGTGDYQGGNSTEFVIAMNNTWGLNLQFERGDQTRIDPASLSTTVWLPYNATDVERRDPIGGVPVPPANYLSPTTSTFANIQPLDYTSRPPDAPVMSTSIMRYGRIAGAYDLTVTRVTVEDPISGRKVEMTSMPFGTTYRGARQHWRLYSPGIGATTAAPPTGHRFDLPPNAECIGDFYDPTNGPYYVP